MARGVTAARRAIAGGATAEPRPMMVWLTSTVEFYRHQHTNQRDIATMCACPVFGTNHGNEETAASCLSCGFQIDVHDMMNEIVARNLWQSILARGVGLQQATTEAIAQNDDIVPPHYSSIAIVYRFLMRLHIIYGFTSWDDVHLLLIACRRGKIMGEPILRAMYTLPVQLHAHLSTILQCIRCGDVSITLSIAIEDLAESISDRVDPL
jgi:hypothetical protein